ncbi:MAG: hypothetical protein IT374_26500 [Polyangiaceae bacterium]|nr:hypothetical protein [Polyangiaceae bacterium]
MTQLALLGSLAEAPSAHGVLDFWPTPDWLARRMIEWADPAPGSRIVEPSAGDGALVRAAREHMRTRGDAWIEAVDVNPAHKMSLHDAGADRVTIGDWPTFASRAPLDSGGGPAFDLCFANPPFSLVATHLLPMATVAKRAVVLLPLTALEGAERYASAWRHLRLTRLAVLVKRPRFGGKHSPATAYCVAEIERGAQRMTRVEWW